MVLKKNIFTIISFILLAILFFITLKNINFELFIQKFSIDFLNALFISQIPLLIALFFITIRHIFFINSNLTFIVTFNAITLSIGLNYIIPGRISELIKATYIRDKANISIGKGIGAIFLERFADLIILALISLISISLFTLKFNITSIIFVLIFVFLITIFIYFDKYILILIDKTIKNQRLRNFFNTTYLHIKTQIFTIKFSIGLFYTLIIWTFSATTIFIFLNVAGIMGISILGTLTVLIGGSIGLAIPALPGGLGTFEAIIVTILIKYGYDFDTALALAIGLRLNNMLLTLPYALLITFKNGTGLKNLYNDLRNKDKF